MDDSIKFCTYVLNFCHSKTEWKFYFDCVLAVVGCIVGPIGVCKIYFELKRITEQRKNENAARDAAAKLKRIEFFFAQHRRLFDDAVLCQITALLDGDDPKLAEVEYWDKKRKFLTFIEEIALLVNSKQISENVAFYMFGYYAICAFDGENFKVGISMVKADWQLFFDFVEKAKIFRQADACLSSDLIL
jgi:hypothetical protein